MAVPAGSNKEIIEDFAALINRSRDIPLYVQLKQALTRQIEAGAWLPGEQLPGEPELCRRFKVSRTVVRQALKDMSYEGRILRQKGRGTFVAEAKITSRSLVQSLTGFYEDMLHRGSPPLDTYLEREIIPARARIAIYLELDELAAVHKITRLRFVQEEPIVLVTSYLPYETCPLLAEADLSNQSLYAYLQESCGLVIERGRRRIDAVVANEHEAKMFQVERGFPLLKMESVSYLSNGQPLEYFKGLFRSDRTGFEVEIVNPAAQGSPSTRSAGETDDFWRT
jgi:GntR family transcriptional regulator